MVQILGIVDGKPYEIQTWSGSSKYLFTSLKEQNVLADVFSIKATKLILRLFQLCSFSADRTTWQFKHHLDTRYLHYLSQLARKKIHLAPQNFDTVLQIGAWYNVNSDAYLNASYHDGNLAMRLNNPFGHPRISRQRIQRALHFEKNIYEGIDVIFTMSKWLKTSFINDFGISPEKIHPIGAGINMPVTAACPEEKYRNKSILMVGRDFARKGGNILLEAFSKVKRKQPDAKLKIVGPTLKNLPEGVECLGYLPKNTTQDLHTLSSLYAQSSVFVLPSLYEPFGISLIEAMAHKTPCIGTDLCAMPEIIENHKSGYLTKPNDPNDLADKIISLISDPAKCRSFGEEGHKRYLSYFTWKQVTRRMVKTLNEHT